MTEVESLQRRELQWAIQNDVPNWYLLDVLLRTVTRESVAELLRQMPARTVDQLRDMVLQTPLEDWMSGEQVGEDARRVLPKELAMPVLYDALEQWTL